MNLKTEKNSCPFCIVQGTFCIYMKCLIVICSKVTIKRRRGEQGQNLVCWFEQMMESGDASNEEAPTTNPRKKDLTKSEWLEVISMLVMMATDYNLQRCAIMDITKRFNVACSMIYRLWEHMACMHATGIINYPDLVLQKNSERAPKNLMDFIQEGSRTCC